MNDESPDDNQIPKPNTDSSHRVRFSDHGNRTIYKTDYIRSGTEKNAVSQVDSSLQPVSPSLVDVQHASVSQVDTGARWETSPQRCPFCDTPLLSGGAAFKCGCCGSEWYSLDDLKRTTEQ